MSIDLSCTVYADANSNKLNQLLRQLLHKGDSSGSLFIRSNGIEILKNLDFDLVKRREFPDGFLSFQQRIEIFPIKSKVISLNDQVTLVSMILRCLWLNKIPAVAACDYEDSLPHNGGYKSAECYQRKQEKIIKNNSIISAISNPIN